METNYLKFVSNLTIENAMRRTYFSSKEAKITDTVFDCMENINKNLMAIGTLFDNLVICGGLAQIKNFTDQVIIPQLNERNDKILINLIPRKASYGYQAPIMGARILAAVPGFKNIMANKISYYEKGAVNLASKIT